jgi:hypothetical protein
METASASGEIRDDNYVLIIFHSAIAGARYFPSFSHISHLLAASRVMMLHLFCVSKDRTIIADGINDSEFS